MCASAPFSNIKSQKIPIQAPYHAPHLFCQDDIEEILQTTSLESWAGYKATIPVVSSTSVKLADAPEFRSLLKSSLEQILLEPIRWEEIGKGLTQSLQRADFTAFRVIPIGSAAEQTVYSALSQEAPTKSSVSSEANGIPASTTQGDHIGRGKTSNIAICGMSGRFPDAEDNAAFWRILEQGLDVHKEVPPLHWDVKTHVDPTGQKKNTSATPYGCWLSNPAAFDARFFFMSPREGK